MFIITAAQNSVFGLAIKGSQWGATSHHWLKPWKENGTFEKMKSARMTQLQGKIDWTHGASSFSPGKRRKGSLIHTIAMVSLSCCVTLVSCCVTLANLF